MRSALGLCLVLLPCCCRVESFVLPKERSLSAHSPKVELFLCHDLSSPTSLLKASSLDTANLENEDHPPIISSLPLKYKSLSIVYALVAATLVVLPDRTLTKKLASKLGGAAGFGVAAAVARLLSQNQLEEPTRQTLTAGLYGFSFWGLMAVPGEAAFLPTAGSAMMLTVAMNAAKLWGVLVTFSGLGIWSAPRKSLGELWSGVWNAVKGLRVPKEAKKRSLVYRNCLLIVLASMVSCLLEGIFYVRYYGSTLTHSIFEISLQWSAVARLFLMSSVIFSLKDLADRNQMTKDTTFIQLNLMVAAWAALAGIGQRLSLNGYSKRWEMIAFSVPFFLKALKYTKLRSDEKGNPPLLTTPPKPKDDPDQED